MERDTSRWSLLFGLCIMAAGSTASADRSPQGAPRAGDALQRRVNRLSLSFERHRQGARALPSHVVSHGVEAVGGLGLLLRGEAGLTRRYRDGKVRPGLMLGVGASGGLAAAAAVYGKKTIFRDGARVPLGRFTIEDSFMPGAGGMHGRQQIGQSEVAGGLGVGVAVMGDGHATSHSHVAEGNTMATGRLRINIPLFPAIKSRWLRRAERGLSLSRQAGALIKARDLAGAERVIGKAEKLEKKLNRLAGRKANDVDPAHTPLQRYDFAP